MFTFGNLIGETGDLPTTTLRVNAADIARTRANLSPRAAVDNPYDHNRDGRVNVLDLGAVRANYLRGLFLLGRRAEAAPAAAAGPALDALDAPITAQVLEG